MLNYSWTGSPGDTCKVVILFQGFGNAAGAYATRYAPLPVEAWVSPRQNLEH